MSEQLKCLRQQVFVLNRDNLMKEPKDDISFLMKDNLDILVS